jgi:hypothetical protein
METEYATKLLGDVEVRSALGHDGKFFFIQANDPWYLEPEIHAAVLDRTIYRGQRMLYPTIAGGFGLFPPKVVVWSLLLVNVLGLGVGSYITARLAQDLEIGPCWGLAFALNVGLLAELDIDGAGIIALILGVLGIRLALRNEFNQSALALAGSVLAREIMAVMALGLVCGLWYKSRTLRPGLLVWPVIGAGVWHLFLRWRLGEVVGTGDNREIASFPFAGIAQAFPLWSTDLRSLLMGLAMIAVLIAFTARALHDRGLLAWSGLPFVGVATLLSVHVWLNPLDIFRGVAPVFTAYGLLIAKTLRQRTAIAVR